MSKLLTPEQERQVFEHQKKTFRNMHKSKFVTGRPLSLEEAAKLLPGRVIQHKIKKSGR